MKTLLVFLTVVSICFSKPSTLEDPTFLFEPTEKNQGFIGQTKLQDEKSAIVENTQDGQPGTLLTQQSLSGSPSQISSLTSQKPRLIKRGYHIYRSADEEQALTEHKQKCNKQVKVDICEDDGETSSNQMRLDTPFLKSRDNMTKDEMKKTLKMVKEVVEHMQKDLQTLEVTSTDLLSEEQLQSGQTKTQLHDDFVVLHTVLDDLVKHIGDSSQNSDSTKENNKPTSKENTEESRMMQWKDTIERIQENSGTNIEDRFVTERNINEHEKIERDVNEEIEKDHLQSGTHSTHEDQKSSQIQTLETMQRNHEDTEMSITQDINGKGTLQSDSLRLGQGSVIVPEEELSKQSDLPTKTDHNTLQKHSNVDAQSSEIQDAGNSNIESAPVTVEAMKLDDNTMMRVDTIDNLQEHMQDKRTLTNMVKRKSDEIEHSLNSDSESEHLDNPNQIDHKDDPEFKSQKDSDVSESATKTDKSESSKKSHEDINEQTQHSHFTKQSTQEMDTDTLQQLKSSGDLDTSFNSHSSIMSPPRVSTQSMEIQSERLNQFNSEMKSDKAGVSHQFSESLNTRLASEHNNKDLKTMDSDEVKRHHEGTKSMFTDHSQTGMTAGKAINNLGNTDEPLQHQFDSQLNTRWAQVNGIDTTMSDPVKMQEEKSSAHSHDTMTKIEHKSDHHQHSGHHGEHMHQFQESLKHDHSGRMPFEEHFVNPSMATSHPNFQSHNGEPHSMRHDSQLSNGRFAHDFYTMPAMRANMGFGDSSNMNMQLQQHSLHPHAHHFSPGMTQSQATFHNEKITESDSVVQASQHIGMREAMLRSGGEYPQHYYNTGNNKGPGYQEQPSIPQGTSSGSGAVGLFPNANVGGCGIPLLLSCSPSVVSGTLAKGHPTYTAPSYRSMDAYRYHKKRETKNANSKHDIKTIPKILFKSKVERTANVIN